MDAGALKSHLGAQSAELGFDAFGVCTPEICDAERARVRAWLAQGRHGDMAWLGAHLERRLFPENALEGARAVICVGMASAREAPRVGEARYARYASGRDYHKVILKKLKRLCETLRAHGGVNRPYVDTGPVLEKALAERAGLGWRGRHSLLTNERQGPWLLLGVIFTTLPLPPDAPHPSRCGSCRRCVAACPTGALDGDGNIDPRRCLAYLTIEYKGALSQAEQIAMGDLLFGCDRCAEACPWGRKRPNLAPPDFAPRALPAPLAASLRWTRADFDTALAGSAARRLGLPNFQRNPCAVLGNIGTADELAALEAFGDAAADPVLSGAARDAAARIRKRLFS